MGGEGEVVEQKRGNRRGVRRTEEERREERRGNPIRTQLGAEVRGIVM